jgi:hypothetical protein
MSSFDTHLRWGKKDIYFAHTIFDALLTLYSLRTT